MNKLMQHLAADLPAETGVRVDAVCQTETGWEAETADGQRYQATALIMTPPPPQALALLAAGEVELTALDG